MKGLAFVLLFGLCASCASTAPITRKDGDEIWEGRAISALAYAWYARGLRLEAEGQLPAAAEAFSEATRADPQSGSAWAALGRVLCKTSPEQAERIFREGQGQAIEQEPLWLERSACSARQNDPTAAIDYALAAVRAQPRSAKATARLVERLEANGETERARAVELSYQQLFSRSAERGRLALEAEASLQQLDAAIDAGDLARAQRLGAGLLPPGVLSLRCFAREQLDLARQQADLVLATDPDQSDALVTTWLLAARQPPAPSSTAAPPPRFTGPVADGRLSTLGALLFADHLRRVAGSVAAALFLDRVGPLEPLDALEEKLAARLGLPLRGTRRIL